MSPILIGAVVTILLAALLYTIAVFAERRSGVLKPAHVWLFWAGLVFDTIGTTLMSEIAGGWKFDIHGILGVMAIVLMLVHAGWATFAIRQRNDAVLHNFHRFSLGVWSLWMVSLLTGFGLAIPRMFAEKAAGA
jgi:uncharacterized repeat protein (TIGR03987 family)